MAKFLGKQYSNDVQLLSGVSLSVRYVTDWENGVITETYSANVWGGAYDGKWFW